MATKTEKKDERVTIMIPYIEGQGTEETFGVNGVFYKVKKGVPVEVPRAVAMIWKDKQEQEMRAIQNQERMKNQVQDLG